VDCEPSKTVAEAKVIIVSENEFKKKRHDSICCLLFADTLCLCLF
jgi:hypothetical protein